MYKLNEIVNEFLLAGDKFMPEIHLNNLVLLIVLVVHLLKAKKGLENSCKQEIQIISRMTLIKLVFNIIWLMVNINIWLKEHNQIRVLRDKVFEIASNPKYDGYQRGLASMVYKFFDKKSEGSIKFSNQQLADELHKPIIRKFKRRKIYSSLKDNIWGVDLADVQLISKYNKGMRYVLCVSDIFSKYTWVVPLKEKKRVFIVSAFQNILDN